MRFFIFFLIFLIQGCFERVRDHMDFLHMGFEKDIYGISLQTKYIGIGIQKADEAKGFGLRFGFIGLYKAGSIESIQTKNSKEFEKKRFGNSYIIYTSQYHSLIFWEFDLKRKMYEYARNCHKKMNNSFSYSDFKYENHLEKDERLYDPFFVEVSGGLYLGFRFGLNFSELFDFVVGFFGYDPAKDDILVYEQFGYARYKSNECLEKFLIKEGYLKDDKDIK